MSGAETEFLKGLLFSQWTKLASATLLLYDHAINLSDEVEHFWDGSWSFSRGMYLCIRYLGLIQAMLLILGDCTNLISPLICAFLLYGLEIATMVLCQGAITIRVWYMFAQNVIIRTIAIGAYITSTCAVATLSGFLWYFVQAEIPQGPTGLNPGRKAAIAWLYVPSLMLHSLLFGLKVYRFVTSPKYMQRDTFLWRFLTEGMIMYACALGSLLFLVIGLTMTEVSDIAVYETAFTGGVVFIALSVVSVCRSMLRIKSLAAVVHVDPGWLLNHAELSRVCWHQGATEGEIVVEGDSFNLPVVSSFHEDADSVPSADTDRIELVKLK